MHGRSAASAARLWSHPNLALTMQPARSPQDMQSRATTAAQGAPSFSNTLKRSITCSASKGSLGSRLATVDACLMQRPRWLEQQKRTHLECFRSEDLHWSKSTLSLLTRNLEPTFFTSSLDLHLRYAHGMQMAEPGFRGGRVRPNLLFGRAMSSDLSPELRVCVGTTVRVNAMRSKLLVMTTRLVSSPCPEFVRDSNKEPRARIANQTCQPDFERKSCSGVFPPRSSLFGSLSLGESQQGLHFGVPRPRAWGYTERKVSRTRLRKQLTDFQNFVRLLQPTECSGRL